MLLDHNINLFLDKVSKRFHINRYELEHLKWYKADSMEYSKRKQLTQYSGGPSRDMSNKPSNIINLNFKKKQTQNTQYVNNYSCI